MEPIGPDVDSELRRLEPENTGADLVEAWPLAVGAGIARHAWPARLARDGTLHVATESATWAFELAHLAPELLARLREMLPGTAPTALRFAVGPVPELPPERTADARRPTLEPTAAESADAARLVAGIADEELLELVRRTAALSLARAPSGGTSDR
jgi:hypothetical protein